MAYEILSALPFIVCLFWTLTLAFGIRRGDRAKRMLTLFVGVNVVTYLCHSFYFNHVYEILPVTDTLYSLGKLSGYPLYYLYIKLLTESRKLTVRDFWIFIPGVVSCVACGVIYAMMEPGERMTYLQQVIFGEVDAAAVSPLACAQALRYKLAGIVFAIQIIPILWSGSRKIVRYNREIVNYYSTTEGKTFSDIRTLLIFFVITSLLSLVMNVIGKDHFADSVWMILIPSLLYSTMLYALGYVGNRHNFTILDFVKDEKKADMEQSPQPEEPALAQEDEARRQALKDKLIYSLEQEEMFREPGLRITDIAARIGSNRAYVSRIINQELQSSFSDLINSYRIEHAKNLLMKPGLPTISIEEISELSGFSSESVFYRVFKSNTGLSPKAWKNKQNSK